jgi:LPS-assembly lipoprotein
VKIMLPRRVFLMMGLPAALAGCGFELRRAPVFPFKSIAVPASSAFAVQVKRNLRAAGTVEVLAAEQAREAEAVLDILGETRESVVISTNAAGQVREMELRFTVRFRVRDKSGRELLAPTAIAQSRDVTYSETVALAKEDEIAFLYRDMETDIAQQLLRRITAARPI